MDVIVSSNLSIAVPPPAPTSMPCSHIHVTAAPTQPAPKLSAQELTSCLNPPTPLYRSFKYTLSTS